MFACTSCRAASSGLSIEKSSESPSWRSRLREAHGLEQAGHLRTDGDRIEGLDVPTASMSTGTSLCVGSRIGLAHIPPQQKACPSYLPRRESVCWRTSDAWRRSSCRRPAVTGAPADGYATNTLISRQATAAVERIGDLVFTRAGPPHRVGLPSL